MGTHQRPATLPIQVQLFGRMEIHIPAGCQPIHVPPRIQQVLAFLLLHPEREYRRDYLAGVFWRRGHQRHSLRQALWMLRSELRRLIPDHMFLAFRGEGVRAVLSEKIVLDVRQFELATRSLVPRLTPRLQADVLKSFTRAVELYRGELLEGSDATWCLEDRERYARRFLAVLDLLMAHYEAVGDHARAAQAATRALDSDPGRESAHRTLMRAMAASRDRTGALRQYARCTSFLRREFGAPPEAETRALYETIKSGGRA